MIDRFRLYAKGGGGGSGCSSSRRSRHDRHGIPDGGFSIIIYRMSRNLYCTSIQATSSVLLFVFENCETSCSVSLLCLTPEQFRWEWWKRW